MAHRGATGRPAGSAGSAWPAHRLDPPLAPSDRGRLRHLAHRGLAPVVAAGAVGSTAVLLRGPAGDARCGFTGPAGVDHPLSARSRVHVSRMPARRPGVDAALPRGAHLPPLPPQGIPLSGWDGDPSVGLGRGSPLPEGRRIREPKPSDPLALAIGAVNSNSMAERLRPGLAHWPAPQTVGRNQCREGVDDLIAVVTSFSGKLYGLRSHGKAKALVDAVKGHVGGSHGA